MGKYYDANVVCRNCGFSGEISIPKKWAITKVLCPECECDWLIKRSGLLSRFKKVTAYFRLKD